MVETVPFWSSEEELRDAWSEWFKLQDTLRQMAKTLSELKNPRITPRTTWSVQLEDDVRRRIQELLLIPCPNVLAPVRLPDDIDSSLMHGVPDKQWLIKRAQAFKKARLAPFKAAQAATMSRTPYWCPPEEWPLYEWNYETQRHVDATVGEWLWDEVMEVEVLKKYPEPKGPYWCPDTEWYLWQPDNVKGWVPDPDWKAKVAHWAASTEQGPVVPDRKHGRDPEDNGEGSSESRRQRTMAGPSGQTAAVPMELDSRPGVSSGDPILLE